MPHIHTGPNQHDMTMSAYIVLVGQGEPKVLVHMHRKHGKLLQIGGHIELDETPWQTVAHEIAEESGYTLNELAVLQPDDEIIDVQGVVMHPVPVFVTTYKITDQHYHSDLSYAFVATTLPQRVVSDGESADLRWLTIAELSHEVEQGVAAKDAAKIYEIIVERYLPTYHRLPAANFSLEKPTLMSI